MKPVTVGEIDQRLSAGATTITGKDRQRGERQLRIDEREVPLEREPAVPPCRGPVVDGRLPVEQSQADRERELEVGAAGKLRDETADLLRGPAARVEQALQPSDRVAL